MSKHALLSASGAHRWMACPPSARIEEPLPDSTSTYAEEGSLAHSIAELKVRKYCIEPMSLRKYNADIKKLQANELYKPEMLTHTDTYLEYIKAVTCDYKSPFVAVEQRLNFSEYVPEGFGTADCIIIANDTMHVIDFKYGQGVPVSPENNPQMMLYALGALSEFEIFYDIKQIKMAIIQPRISDEFDDWVLSADELKAWGETILKPAAARAYAGEGDITPGTHCKFCKAKATCKPRAQEYMALDVFTGTDPVSMGKDEIGHILARLGAMVDWAKELQEYALSEALKGEEIPGWKIVSGRSMRYFTDAEKAYKTIIDSGINEAMMYERKPISLTALEKLVGAKQFTDLVGDMIDKSEGKPTLVPLSDKREAKSFSKTTAVEDFEGVNE